MRLTVWRVIGWAVLALLAVLLILVALNWSTIQRVALGGVKVYEDTPPQLPARLQRPAILVFSKTNGFRHEEAIPAAHALFAGLARDNGWGHFQTENGATFNPAILARFDAVVFNNVSGDVFRPAQRDALRRFVEDGGGFVAIHGSGGDASYDWRWYVERLIGAQFTGHPMGPQFQRATVRVIDRTHPATRSLPASWPRVDEWYSFEAAPPADFNILATLDERTYSPKGPLGQDLAMGANHPIAWWHCVGRGRALYSALGHRAAAYAEPHHRALLAGAIRWALGQEGTGCRAAAPAPASPAPVTG